jgi:hypothetical protein
MNDQNKKVTKQTKNNVIIITISIILLLIISIAVVGYLYKNDFKYDKIFVNNSKSTSKQVTSIASSDQVSETNKEIKLKNPLLFGRKVNNAEDCGIKNLRVYTPATKKTQNDNRVMIQSNSDFYTSNEDKEKFQTVSDYINRRKEFNIMNKKIILSAFQDYCEGEVEVSFLKEIPDPEMNSVDKVRALIMEVGKNISNLSVYVYAIKGENIISLSGSVEDISSEEYANYYKECTKNNSFDEFCYLEKLNSEENLNKAKLTAQNLVNEFELVD